MLSESDLPFYRPAVGIMLVNAAGLAFIGRRIDMPAGLAAWQMPQGGIDPGESPREAAFRELKEEVGTDKADILAETESWLHYDLPVDIVPRMWSGRWRGQRQKWFLMRFTGSDADIDLTAHEPEFSAFQWVCLEDLPGLIVPFKRGTYKQVVAAFRSLAGA